MDGPARPEPIAAEGNGEWSAGRIAHRDRRRQS
jgi:hypothetical protein